MKRNNKALILGSGFAGMFAAHALSAHYDEVVITDRDRFPDGPENRPGTPQAYHPHRLLERGKLLLEDMFPGLFDELLTRGAYPRAQKKVHLSNRFGTLEMPDEPSAGCSRALLEWTIRNRINRLPNVRFLTGLSAQGLRYDARNNIVTGATFRHLDNKQSLQIQADLVIDATGRSSKLAQWLRDDLGLSVPQAERLHVSLGYSTRHYKIPEDIRDEWSTVLYEGNPLLGRGTAVFNTIEDNLAEIVLYRAGGASYPATQGEAYDKEVAEQLGSAMGTWLERLEPVGAPRGYRIDTCLRQHYDVMEHWPTGLLAIGDALCSFDPIFGQGITVAAIQSETLRSWLQVEDGEHPRSEQTVLKKMQEATAPAWWLSCVADLRWPGVRYEGTLSIKGMAFAQTVLDFMQEQAFGHQQMEVFGEYMMVNSLISSPSDLFNAERILALMQADTSGENQVWLKRVLHKEHMTLSSFLKAVIPAFDGIPTSIPQGLPEEHK
ncbi:FAD-dependent monooxygenase [Paenibacillus sp. JCM 10914]|uniref:NAD(P)/FAD-dependent oxidoreductase n=1 Tax=Paenibacillus sp. JCM 10914 TaxID=1236974 RepID=UPI00056776B4|nr:FAD-dependent oxidoreductase [Paenibacillus sp. JCM 10914]